MTRVAYQPSSKSIQQINDVKRFLNSQHALLLIIGEIASGKTTLLSEVVMQIRDARNIIRLQGTPKSTPSQLISTLSKHWEVESLDQDQRMETQLDDLLNSLTNQNQSCILVIDDAHLLPLSALAAISYLVSQQDKKRARLHIILSGLPTLSEKISSLLTKEIQQITVGALSREEAFRKINGLLETAGLYLPHAAANAIFTKIYRHSAGMPETLENMVKKLLAQRTAGETKTALSPEISTLKPIRLWRAHRIKTFSLITLVLLGYAFWGWQHHVLPNFPHTITLAQQTNTPVKPAKLTLPKPAAVTPIIKNQHYTLQLMSGMNVQAMTNFIQQHHLNPTAQIMKTQYKGHDWYVLTYGNYEQASQAKAALAALPTTLTSRHAWVRSTQQLQSISGPSSHRSIE